MRGYRLMVGGVLAAREPHDYFPIRVLCELTGVGAPTLRAWERRYRLLAPRRTPKGHRLYTGSDVERVRQILAGLDQGHSLPAIAARLGAGQAPVAGAAETVTPDDTWSGYRDATLQAVRDFSTERVEAVYNEASSLYPLDLVTGRLIEPVLQALGDSWQSRPTGITEEHFYANWLRNRLGARFHHLASQARGCRILCACLPGNRHEIGLMLFALAAMMRGYRVLYLGTDVPREEIAAAVERSGCQGVLLASRLEVDSACEQSLATLQRQLPVPLLLGGPGSERPLPRFERAGGVRLGAHIPIALRTLEAHVALFATGGGGA